MNIELYWCTPNPFVFWWISQVQWVENEGRLSVFFPIFTDCGQFVFEMQAKNEGGMVVPKKGKFCDQNQRGCRHTEKNSFGLTQKQIDLCVSG